MFKDNSTDPLLKKYLLAPEQVNCFKTCYWNAPIHLEAGCLQGLFVSTVSSRDISPSKADPVSSLLSSPISSVSPPIAAPQDYCSPVPGLTLDSFSWPSHRDQMAKYFIHSWICQCFCVMLALCAYTGHYYFGAWTLTRIFSLAGLEPFQSYVQIQSPVHRQGCLGDRGHCSTGLWQRGVVPAHPWWPQECYSKLVYDSMEWRGMEVMAAVDGAVGSSVPQCRPCFLVSEGWGTLASHWRSVCSSTWLIWAPQISPYLLPCFQPSGKRPWVLSPIISTVWPAGCLSQIG